MKLHTLETWIVRTTHFLNQCFSWFFGDLLGDFRPSSHKLMSDIHQDICFIERNDGLLGGNVIGFGNVEKKNWICV